MSPREKMSGPEDPRNPYGVTRPTDRLLMGLLLARFGILPRQDVLDQLERENGVEPGWENDQ